MIKLTEISNKDIDLLYEILKKRKPEESITHIENTTYDEHVKFVKSKPYFIWYIINKNDKKIGTIYLSKQDEIGIFIKKEFQNEGIGIKALELLIKKNPRKKFFANVNPKNFKSVQFFENFGFKLIHNTYELNIL
jgi:RimJ/RimL family protein N-acetyltransferase